MIVVLDLHDFVTRGEGRAETLDAVVTWWIQRCLQFEIERARAEPPAIHRAEHLNLAYRIDGKASRNPLSNEQQQLAHRLVGVHRFDEEEVGAVVCAEFWHEAAIDPMRVGDNAARGRLAEDFEQPDHGHGLGGNEVREHLPRSDGRKLIDVPD